MGIGPGSFCWVEVGTTDVEAGTKFYTQLFGWEAEEADTGPGGKYTLLRLGGKDAAGLYSLNEQQRSMNVPPHWLSYVAVADTDAMVNRASELGGRTLMPPTDIPDVGRFAVLQDPTGGVFSILEASGEGNTVTNVPGAFVWNELVTDNTEVAGKFYMDLFGWTAQTDAMPTGGPYTTFMNGDKRAGGMVELSEDMKKGNVPPNWIVYFSVADCDESAAKATELGGKVMMAPTDIPGVGRFAGIFDPQGTAFAIIKMEMSVG